MRPHLTSPSRGAALAAALLLLSACGARGSTPAPRPAAAPGATPAQPAAQAPATDTAKGPRRSPVYLVLNLDLHGGRLHTANGAVVAPEEKPGLGSFELALQKARGGGLGIAIRSVGGEEAAEYAEAAFLMGSRVFALDLGAATRTGFNTFTGGAFDTTYTFARAGFRSRANLGNTDFSVTMRGLYYIGLPTPEEEALPSDLEGWSGETGLSWTWNRFPLTANLGYRIERFRVFAVEQEVSSLYFGGGLLLGRR